MNDHDQVSYTAGLSLGQTKQFTAFAVVEKRVPRERPHDDFVLAVAVAVWQAKRPAQVWLQVL